METTLDLFLDGQVKLHQPKDGYRAATDPVLLAASIPAKKGQKVLDVGCGVGAASFCLAARIPGVRIEGLEIQKPLLEIAAQNLNDNSPDWNMAFFEGNVKERSMEPLPNSFDHVMANPPFYEAGSGHRPPNEIKARAHMEEDADLPDWVNYMLRMAKPRGTVTFINRAERLEETLSALEGRLGELILAPIWSMNPASDKRRPAKRFILQGRKGIKSPMSIVPGLIVHDENGGYTPQAVSILRDGAALDLKV